MHPATIARLLAGIDASGGLDACWLWTRACNSSGYPQTSVNGRSRLVTRLVLELVGAPRTGPNALHTCDVPRCCNPAHLRWGSQAENIADAVRRGRWRNRTGGVGSRLT